LKSKRRDPFGVTGAAVFCCEERCLVPKAIYDERKLGEGYARRRRPDPRIAAMIDAALGDVRSVVNVGAGAGSYEPADRVVQAVEPSEVMIGQRAADAAPCVQALAEELPFADGSFDAAMAILTIHHWSDWRAGLREMRRVARRRVVLLTFDVEAPEFWLTRDYFPALSALDREIMPRLKAMANELGAFHATPAPIPHDCVDGFLGAYWRRPEVYLDPVARGSMSSFARIDAEDGLKWLAQDVESGAWAQRYGDLLKLDALDVGYRLLVWELARG
jgi:SAM-dependent methyltransferase